MQAPHVGNSVCDPQGRVAPLLFLSPPETLPVTRPQTCRGVRERTGGGKVENSGNCSSASPRRQVTAPGQGTSDAAAGKSKSGRAFREGGKQLGWAPGLGKVRLGMHGNGTAHVARTTPLAQRRVHQRSMPSEGVRGPPRRPRWGAEPRNTGLVLVLRALSESGGQFSRGRL